MTERHLTKWEVEEFVDQVSQRPKLWFGKDKLWVRRRDGENHFAIKFINGLPDEMSTLYVKLLNEKESVEEVERLVERLVVKFTSYGWRKEIEQYLLLEGIEPDKLERIARTVTSPESALHSKISALGYPGVPDISETSTQSPSMETKDGSRGVEHREVLQRSEASASHVSEPPRAVRVLSKQMLRLLK